MQWEKKGLVFMPDGKYNWNKSHAQLPITDTHYPAVWRIYYAARNIDGESNISYIEVEKNNPCKICYIHKQPILSLGKLGTFDENGMMPVALIQYNEQIYLYYAGWSLKKTVPYHNSIGLAISNDNGKTFEKFSAGPLFDTKPFEPFSTGTINILIKNDVWQAWYQSITKWEIIDNKPEPFYIIKYAESTDGINWNRNNIPAIDFKDDLEAGICSASVLIEDLIYKMWYCYRKSGDYRHNKTLSYRIGYAESTDGIKWTRRDEKVGIDVSPDGWDSGMIAYPNVFIYNKKKIMFYNGNGFGSSGFGYAVSKD